MKDYREFLLLLAADLGADVPGDVPGDVPVRGPSRECGGAVLLDALHPGGRVQRVREKLMEEARRQLLGGTRFEVRVQPDYVCGRGRSIAWYYHPRMSLPDYSPRVGEYDPLLGCTVLCVARA